MFTCKKVTITSEKNEYIYIVHKHTRKVQFMRITMYYIYTYTYKMPKQLNFPYMYIQIYYTLHSQQQKKMKVYNLMKITQNMTQNRNKKPKIIQQTQTQQQQQKERKIAYHRITYYIVLFEQKKFVVPPSNRQSNSLILPTENKTNCDYITFSFPILLFFIRFVSFSHFLSLCLYLVSVSLPPSFVYENFVLLLSYHLCNMISSYTFSVFALLLVVVFDSFVSSTNFYPFSVFYSMFLKLSLDVHHILPISLAG